MLDFASEIRGLSGGERVTEESFLPGRVLRFFLSEVRRNDGGFGGLICIEGYDLILNFPCYRSRVGGDIDILSHQ